jgi:hypothetical protein
MGNDFSFPMLGQNRPFKGNGMAFTQDNNVYGKWILFILYGSYGTPSTLISHLLKIASSVTKSLKLGPFMPKRL